MYHAVRTLSIACIAAFSLAACGGGGATVPTAAKPGAVVPGNQARHVLSIPCTPDSYGYCYVRTYHGVVQQHCDAGGYSTTTTNKYEVYNSTTDLGLYTQLISTNCDGIEATGWHPGDPAVIYSDPNLP